MPSLADLRHHLGTLGRVVLGYSGGVDSAFLAVALLQALGRERFLAVIGRSASYPEVQWRTAMSVAQRFDIPLLEVDTAELDDPRYRANTTDRCYFCKHELWQRLQRVASERGYETIIDGTIVDDLAEHRPGARAGHQAGIRSPLAELGWTKDDVRLAAERLGLPVWDAPAAPCLASRVRYGVEVTADRLGQVERAEAFLRSLGLEGDLRVRHLGRRSARVETAAEAIPLAQRSWASIERKFREFGFDAVALDPKGYRRGSLLPGVGAS